MDLRAQAHQSIAQAGPDEAGGAGHQDARRGECGGGRPPYCIDSRVQVPLR